MPRRRVVQLPAYRGHPTRHCTFAHRPIEAHFAASDVGHRMAGRAGRQQHVAAAAQAAALQLLLLLAVQLLRLRQLLLLHRILVGGRVGTKRGVAVTAGRVGGRRGCSSGSGGGRVMSAENLVPLH